MSEKGSRAAFIIRLAEWRKVRSQKAKEERIASDKTTLNEREIAMQQEIQELKKARLNCTTK